MKLMITLLIYEIFLYIIFLYTKVDKIRKFTLH